MERLTSYAALALLLLVAGGCGGDPPEAVDPVFTVTATPVTLQTGGDGLQFFATSDNVDVALTSVDIRRPVASPVVRHMFTQAVFHRGEEFGLQASEEAYEREVGTWAFDFVGTRPADGAAFAVSATFVVGP